MAAVLMIVILALIGAAQIVAGIYILAGSGWALVALGLLTIASAGFVSRGVSSGG